MDLSGKESFYTLAFTFPKIIMSYEVNTFVNLACTSSGFFRLGWQSSHQRVFTLARNDPRREKPFGRYTKMPEIKI
jgi:hypothetical protein